MWVFSDKGAVQNQATAKLLTATEIPGFVITALVQYHVGFMVEHAGHTLVMLVALGFCFFSTLMWEIVVGRGYVPKKGI